ncbi:hypothetical protein [uncultured Bacteroides sp.]|uniref:hypothetical protein n=1 Tax=uncultured Bacteroides sp. TaxID=162156 RepID=UPI0025CF5E8F|nr:hypothetical protein [uncultured Bacteroides sp.]
MRKKFVKVMFFGALALSTVTYVGCKDYDDDIDSLREHVETNQATLDAKIKELKDELAAAKQDIVAAQNAAKEAKTAAEKAEAAAKEAAATAKAEAIEAATKMAEDLRATISQYDGRIEELYDSMNEFGGVKDDVKTLQEKLLAIEGVLSAVDGGFDKLVNEDKLNSAIAAAKEALEIQINTLKNFKEAIDALNLETEFPEMKAKLVDLEAELGELSATVSELQTAIDTNTADIATLKADVAGLATELTTISNSISEVQSGLNTLVSLLSQRLTALTFAPSQFINGIEVINFTTLQYTPWTKLLADQAEGTKKTSINDGKTTAYYYANPSNVKKENILGLTVITNDATNEISTRAGERIAATVAEIKDGKVAVNLKKLSEGSFNQESVDGKEKFAMMAIQAKIALTAEEQKAGVSPVVTSDWARLAETSAIPYIHYVEAETEVDADKAHFWKYSTIHDQERVCTTQGQYILKKIEYTKTDFDLNSLVEVCDKEGNKYNISDYGLKFEFELVNYFLQDTNEESTNQKEFAKIENGIITSQSRNGVAFNRDAIGREPLVQVVLKNTANNEVVDVRYFKIAWTSQSGNIDLGELDADFDAEKFACDATYTGTVGMKEMNDQIYTIVNGGISKEEFHALYKLDSRVYATLDDAKNGASASTVLGTIEDVTAEGSTTTHNLKWTIGNIGLTKEEYEAGKVERTVYGRYYRISDEAETYTFKITMTLAVDKMAFVGGYNSSYWSGTATTENINKSFQINPALTSDANYGIANFFDCQIIGSILPGYNKNAGLTSVMDLVSNADEAEFRFDETRAKTLLGTEWKVINNVLYKGTVAAAEINGDVIRLFESTLPTTTEHGVATSAAQELLGKSVPVKLVATNCAGIPVELDHFLVNFINPLAMSLNGTVEPFKDLLTGGSTVSVDKVVTIKESFGEYRKVWENGAAADAQLVQWYNVEQVTWNLAKATTNLKKEGENIIISDKDDASTWSTFADKYVLEPVLDANGQIVKLTFKNNSGAHIQQEFRISVPVYVKTKWSPILADPEKTTVTLTVKPGSIN